MLEVNEQGGGMNPIGIARCEDSKLTHIYPDIKAGVHLPPSDVLTLRSVSRARMSWARQQTVSVSFRLKGCLFVISQSITRSQDLMFNACFWWLLWSLEFPQFFEGSTQQRLQHKIVFPCPEKNTWKITVPQFSPMMAVFFFVLTVVNLQVCYFLQTVAIISSPRKALSSTERGQVCAPLFFPRWCHFSAWSPVGGFKNECLTIKAQGKKGSVQYFSCFRLLAPTIREREGCAVLSAWSEKFCLHCPESGPHFSPHSDVKYDNSPNNPRPPPLSASPGSASPPRLSKYLFRKPGARPIEYGDDFDTSDDSLTASPALSALSCLLNFIHAFFWAYMLV